MRNLLLTVFSLTGLLILTGTAAAQEPVKIGLMAPITGRWAAEGEGMRRIVNLLAEEVNKSGGLGGRPVDIVLVDDAGDPRTAALAAQRLISQGVIAAIGTYGSAVTEASQSIYDEAGLVQVATGSTSIRLTEKGLTRFFRTCPRDDEQGRVLADEVMKLNPKSVAILHDNTSYAKGLASEVQEHFKRRQLKIVFDDALTPGERDYTVILTKLKAANPDILVFTGYYPEAAMLLRQKLNMNWNAPMIGGDATNNTSLVKTAGLKAAAGYLFVSPPGPGDMPTEEGRAFMETYRKAHGALPASVWAVMAGDAFKALAKAIEAVGPEPEKMAAYMHDRKEWQGFTGFSGPISFNEKGDREGDVYRLYEVSEEGEFVLKN